MHRSSIVNLFSGADSPDRVQEDGDGSEQGGGEHVEELAPEPVAVELSPRFAEQAAILTFAMEMRNESSFCDISFVVNGSIFRAHRVIVSAWSRWLRALLCEGDDEVVTLDLFAADAFAAVLDYMYGQSILFSTRNADDLLKVVRRLELRDLEQECWKHLLSAADASNCRELHELADRFDCPPLKLTCWHMLQDMQRGYGANPVHRLLTHAGELDPTHAHLEPPPMPYALKGNGLTGPGEAEGLLGTQGDHGSEDDEYLSVFNDYTSEFRAARGEDGTTLSEEQEQLFPMPEQLPPGAPAADVIKAWAYKLQLVYDMCVPKDGYNEYGDGLEGRGRGYGDDRYDDEGHGRPGEDAHSPPSRRQNRGGEENGDSEYATIKQNLIDYYTDRGLTDKIASVDNIISNFDGREEMIFKALHDKYDDPSSPDYIRPNGHKTRGQPRQNSKGFLGGLFS